MRLLKVGRDASCDIVLHSDKVSSLHAEITILNNGDILLEDKGSRNGTFLMNKPIKPGTAVTIRRGDMIRFADVELQWNQIPMPEDNSNFKALYGIGTNFRNEIQISGNTASRFHATLKIGKDGKPYLQDHSKNGTTVNGMRIAKGQNVRIKRSDAIVCGGVPVDLKQFIPPVIWKKILIGIAAAAVFIGIIFGVKTIIPSIFDGGGKPKDYIQSVAYVRGFYHYEVKIVNDPFVDVLKQYGIEYSNEYAIGKDENGNFGFITSGSDGRYQYFPIGYEGTAFFISRDGKLMTNRHIACPWEYAETEEKVAIDQAIRNLREALLPINSLRTESEIEAFNAQEFALKPFIAQLNKKGYSLQRLSALIAGFKESPIEIKGVQDDLQIGYSNYNYTSPDEFEHCTMIAESGNEDIDLAILQLNNKRTPETITQIIDVSKSVVDPKEINPLEESYYYIGYPLGTYLNLNNQDGGLRPLLNEVKASRTPGKYQFSLQGEVFGGASGSPILDKKGRLVGIVNQSIRYTTMSMGVLAKYAKDLMDKIDNK